jgi:hypothetical protein
MHALLGYRPTPTTATVVAFLALIVAAVGSVTAIRASDPVAPLPGGMSTMREVKEHGVVKPWGKAVEVIADCPEGFLVVSGGYLSSSPYTVAVANYPALLGDKWVTVFVNPVGLPARRANVTVYAICVEAGVPVVF